MPRLTETRALRRSYHAPASGSSGAARSSASAVASCRVACAVGSCSAVCSARKAHHAGPVGRSHSKVPRTHRVPSILPGCAEFRSARSRSEAGHRPRAQSATAQRSMRCGRPTARRVIRWSNGIGVKRASSIKIDTYRWHGHFERIAGEPAIDIRRRRARNAGSTPSRDSARARMRW